MAQRVETARTQPAVAARADAQENPLVTWLEARRKYLVSAVVVVALLGLGAWFLVESGRRKEAFAAQALDRARAAMDRGDLPQASSEFQRVAQTFRGTDAAMEATLALNQVRMMSGQNELAVTDLKRFIATNPPPYYLSGAESHLGNALENLGKPLEAAPAYLKAAEVAKEDYRKVDALLAAARAYRAAGKDNEAIETLRRIVKDFKDTPGSTEAQVRLAEMTKGRL